MLMLSMSVAVKLYCETGVLWNKDRREKWSSFVPVSAGFVGSQQSQVNHIGAKKPEHWNQTDTSHCALYPVPCSTHILYASVRFELVLISQGAHGLWIAAECLLKGRNYLFWFFAPYSWLFSVLTIWSKWKPLDWNWSQASSAALLTGSISFNGMKVKCRHFVDSRLHLPHFSTNTQCLHHLLSIIPFCGITLPIH